MSLPTKTDWRRVAARMRAELERADLNERPRALAMWAIKPTLMRGRVRVIIPVRAEVCRLLGIGPTHLGAVAAELAETGILTLKEVHEGWELLVYPDSTLWQVRWKHARHEMDALLAAIDRAPGQVQGELLEPEPCLAMARALVAAETVGGPAVPERGTGRPVPFLGTAPVNSKDPLTVNRFTALKQSNSSQLTPERERDAMDLLRELVGQADVAKWGGDWRKNWLRRHPDAFQAALLTIRDEMKTGWAARKSVGAAIKDLTLRYVAADRRAKHE